MKVNVEKTSSVETKVNIDVPASVVQSTYHKFFVQIQKDVELKGFRKGKAPITKVKSLYADRVKRDVVQDLLTNQLQKAIIENNIPIAGEPSFEFDDLNDDQNFTFTAQFEVHPEVQLSNYQGLKVRKEKYEFDPSKVEKIINNILESHSKTEPITETRPAALKDVVVIDFDGVMDGKPLKGGSSVDHEIKGLGSGQFIPGFEEGIVGMNIDETKTLNLVFPEDYSGDLAGKPVEFKITLKKILKNILPEFNEEFLKSINNNQTVEEFKATIRKEVEESEKKRIDDKFKEEVVKVLIAHNPVDVPPSLLEKQKKALHKNFEARLKQQGMTQKDLETYKEKWAKDFEATAKGLIQSSYLIDEIATKNNLFCTQEDFENKMQQNANQTGIDLEKVMNYYSDSERKTRTFEQITHDRVLEFVISKSNVVEVPGDVLQDTKD